MEGDMRSNVLVWGLVCLLLGCSPENQKFQGLMDKRPPKKPVPEEETSITTQNVKANVEIDNWFTKDPELDNAEGVSADKAYDQLKLNHAKEVVVAVIDSGVDIYHEDLKSKIWTNKNEIPNNKIDDDKNGYIDDMNGWNYIGGYDAEGKPTHINQEQLEVTRELIKMKAKKKAAEEQGTYLPDDQMAYLNKLSQEVESARTEATEALELIGTTLAQMKQAFEVVKSLLQDQNFEKLTKALATNLVVSTEEQKEAQKVLVESFTKLGASDVARIIRVQGIYSDDINYYYNEAFLPRSIVGDLPDDFSDVVYGNNDVVGVGADHGTHVAGIIAADRSNDLGVRGIAENVRIMALRVVPDGDERDKDVALAVRYAADNGAHIINMSFGKGYSPNKKEVGEAFVYAASKGVLIFHAAGNESTDRDQEDRFPMRFTYTDEGDRKDEISTYFDVGASSQFKTRELTATFTNFGQTIVDLFAPGVRIKSTIPNNEYAIFSGTSMACPSAVGVAALVWSQNPQLTALEVKDLLMKTTRSRAGLLVRLPSDHSKDVLFETLSKTGGIIDAFRALSL